MFTLSPQGRAVAALVLAFLALTGSLNRAAYAVVGLFDLDITSKSTAIVATFLIVALTVAVFLYARGATAQDGWGAPLAQAACALALVALAIASVNLLAAVFQGEQVLFPGIHVFDAVD